MQPKGLILYKTQMQKVDISRNNIDGTLREMAQ
jgi:hypothetical protein